MKSVLSFALIVCMVASALPVAAQEEAGPPTPAMAGPLTRAAMREADRLVAAGGLTPSGGDAVQQGDKGTAKSDWPRAFNVAPGTEVIVTVRGSQPGTRYVVRADESDLTVLNLSNLPLQFDARRVLVNMASRQPEYLTDPDQAGVVVQKDVRVGPDGVFMADRKVADLGQIVERITRNDVAEIRTPKSERNAFECAVEGYFVGGGGGRSGRRPDRRGLYARPRKPRPDGAGDVCRSNRGWGPRVPRVQAHTGKGCLPRAASARACPLDRFVR